MSCTKESFYWLIEEYLSYNDHLFCHPVDGVKALKGTV